MRFSRATRRAFLQGVSGYSLAVPFLPSLMPTRALAAVDRQPMRFVMIYNRYGRNPSRWFTSTLPLAPSADGSYRSRPLSDIPGDLSPILGPAYDVPLRKKIAIVQGLNCMTAEIAHNGWFATTGSARPPSGGTGFGYSIDAVLEESPKFYPTAPMVGAIRTAVDSEANTASWSYSSKSGIVQHLAAEWNVTALYDRFFNPTSVQSMKTRNDRVRGLVANEVFDDYKRTMTGRRISSQDKIRLDNYVSLLNQIQTKLAAPVISCSKAGAPGALDDYDKIQAAAMDMEVAALACGMTKIVMHGLMQYLPSMPSGRNDYTWHAEAHNGHRNGENNKWHAAKVAELAKKLDSITEADGNTMLDNTFFMYANEDSTGSHQLKNMPIIVGGAKGKLQTDQIIDYRDKDRPGRPYNNLLITAFKAFGFAEEDYKKFPNQNGFGAYESAVTNYAPYVPFLTSAGRNAPLPGLLAG